jgi:hypothetical protein
MKRLLHEPLLHFLLIGAALFAAYEALNGHSGAAGSIVVTRGQIESLATGFERIWHHAPSFEELQGLIDSQVREEVYVREALVLGLDRDDAVIRNRLRLKMEFISDIAAPREPTDDELRAYLVAHPEAFRAEPRFTFTQVYLDPSRHGERLRRDAGRLLAQLDRAGEGARIDALGDATLLESRFSDLRSSEVAGQFGDRFAARLGELPLRRWQGPLESGYGAHLVFVSERAQAGMPALGEVRNAVRRAWENAQRVERSEKLYQDLRRRYTVTIEAPPAAEVAQR